MGVIMSNSDLLELLLDENGAKLLGDSYIALLTRLLELSDGECTCSPSVGQLCSYLGFEDRKVRRLIKKLRERKIINVYERKIGNGNYSNIFDLTEIYILLDEQEKKQTDKKVAMEIIDIPPSLTVLSVQADVDPTDKILIDKDDLYTEEIHKKVMEEAYRKNIESFKEKASRPRPMTRGEKFFGCRWEDQDPELMELARQLREEGERRDEEELLAEELARKQV